MHSVRKKHILEITRALRQLRRATDCCNQSDNKLAVLLLDEQLGAGLPEGNQCGGFCSIVGYNMSTAQKHLTNVYIHSWTPTVIS